MKGKTESMPGTRVSLGDRWCREGESTPTGLLGPADFKSRASASFAIPARVHSSNDAETSGTVLWTQA